MLHDIYKATQSYQGNWQDDLGYGQVVTHWKLEVNMLGYAFTPLTRLDAKTNKQLPGQKILCPDKSRSTEIYPIFPDDNGAYLFGLWGYQSRQQHKAYLSLLAHAIAKTRNPRLTLYKEWLERFDKDERLQKEFKQRFIDSYKKGPQHNTPEDISKDRIIVVIDGERLSAMPDIKTFWQEHFIESQKLKTGVDIITGEQSDSILTEVIPVKIKGVNNTLSSGASLISFGRTAFTSYGLTDSENTSIDFKATLKLYSFLNNLLASDQTHLRLGNLSVLIWGDALNINKDFWSADSSLEDYCAAKGLNLFTCNKTGKSYRDISELDGWENSLFHVLILKGNSGRVSIENYQKITAQELAGNILKFAESQLVSLKHYENQKEETMLTVLNIWQIRRLCFREPKHEHYDEFDKSLLDSLLFNKPLPVTFIHKIMSCFFSNPKCDYFQLRRILKGIAIYFSLKEENKLYIALSPQLTPLLEILRVYVTIYYRVNPKTRPAPMSEIKAFISLDKVRIARAVNSMFTLYRVSMINNELIECLRAIASYLPLTRISYDLFLKQMFNVDVPTIAGELNLYLSKHKEKQLSPIDWIAVIKDLLDTNQVTKKHIGNLCKQSGLKHWETLFIGMPLPGVPDFESQALNLWYLM